MVLGTGRPTNLEKEGQGSTVLSEGAGGVVLTFVSLIYHFSSFSLSGRRPDID